jgi:hypothetical protein
VPTEAGKGVLLRVLEMFATGDIDAAGEIVAEDQHHRRAARD